MNYNKFVSDLSLSESIEFNSAEENEEILHKFGVNQKIRQLKRGVFQSHMMVRDGHQLSLFADRINIGTSIHLEPPEDMVALFFPRSADGCFKASGCNINNDKLIFFPDNKGIDIVTSGLAGSEALVIEKNKFDQLMQALYPTLKWQSDIRIIAGNTIQLNRIKSTLLNF